jgi:DNA invertase Pin-like site-specific DNA recombinase
VENDVSAYKTKVVRPEFEALLDGLKLGLVDGVVLYDLDRFARQPVDLERAIRIFDDRPGLVFATVQSDIDLSTSDGRTMARVMVAFANKSSMDTSRPRPRPLSGPGHAAMTVRSIMTATTDSECDDRRVVNAGFDR